MAVVIAIAAAHLAGEPGPQKPRKRRRAARE